MSEESEEQRPAQGGNGTEAKGDVADMAVSIFRKVRNIKKDNPEISAEIDQLELDIREKIVEIKDQIDKLDERDRELVTVLVVNGLHRTAEEVLIGEPVDSSIP